MKKILAKILFFALLTATISCSTTVSTNQTVNVNAINAANTNTVTAVNAGQSSQTAVAPDAVVADLYKQHDIKKSPFFQTKDRALVDKYFTRKTADMIWKDAVETKPGEMSSLEADPLYDAQDTDIKKFSVGKATVKDKIAEVPVSFENFGKKQTLAFTLLQENGEWKIEDIRYPEHGKFTDFFKNNVPDNGKKGESKDRADKEFEGRYQVGDTTCTVKPVKMAFEVRWEKGSGVEMFFFESRDNDKYIFASRPEKGKANVFAFDDENYDTGTFYRADEKEFTVKRLK